MTSNSGLLIFYHAVPSQARTGPEGDFQFSLEQAGLSVSDPVPFNVSFSWDDPNKRGEGRPAICGPSAIFSAM